MFEGLVASILNKWLGKYVEDLDTEQFNVGIFSGEVKLYNLKLKPEALFELELPIEVKYGVIGEMSLTIPWSSLSSQAIAVSIEEIFIVANPVGFDEFDAEKEKRLLRTTRKKILDDLEGEGLFGSGNGTLLDGLLSALANNIQLFVRKVHVRYEDRSIQGGIACGICIQGMSIETTNSKWKPCTIPAGSGTVYQLARLEAMAVYLNTGLDNSGWVSDNWQEDMALGLQTFSIQGKNFDFLIKPFSAKMKVIVSRSSEARVPKLLVDLVIQDAVVQLSRAQMQAIVAVLHLFKQINLRREFLHIRIHEPVHKNARSWWKYSYKAVLQQRVYPYTWEKIRQHRENYRQYKELYKQAALNPGDTELRLDLGRAEDKLDLSSIVIAREHAKIEIKNEDPDRIEITSNEEKWWSLNVNNNNNYSCLKFQIKPDKPRGLWSQLSGAESLKLNELLGKTEEPAAPEKAKKYIEHKVNLTLHHFTASVFVRGSEIASLSLSQFLGSFESRPAAQAFKVSARAESFTVEGASIEHGLVPILTVDNMAGNSSSNFLSIDFEKNPLAVEADYGITVNVEPTEFIYHEHAVSEFLSFFQGIGIAENTFKTKWLSLRDNIIRLKSLIESRQLRIYVNMNIKAPHVVIAETGSLQKAGMVAVLDFGRWTLRSDLQLPLCLDEVTQMELEERLYDRLHINLDGFQLLFTDSGTQS
ncbi:UNVERIFIED_CONTAM: hypothetical protein PYX00_003683 [Menopon gallinae]|uniref:Chorein N-terminal domain-containing protein n=1 Tax=Menopon gallinae TaxID=328185 RepID=A0AAW2I2J7_9NEOP